MGAGWNKKKKGISPPPFFFFPSLCYLSFVTWRFAITIGRAVSQFNPLIKNPKRLRGRGELRWNPNPVFVIENNISLREVRGEKFRKNWYNFWGDWERILRSRGGDSLEFTGILASQEREFEVVFPFPSLSIPSFLLQKDGNATMQSKGDVSDTWCTKIVRGIRFPFARGGTPRFRHFPRSYPVMSIERHTVSALLLLSFNGYTRIFWYLSSL